MLLCNNIGAVRESLLPTLSLGSEHIEGGVRDIGCDKLRLRPLLIKVSCFLVVPLLMNLPPVSRNSLRSFSSSSIFVNNSFFDSSSSGISRLNFIILVIAFSLNALLPLRITSSPLYVSAATVNAIAIVASEESPVTFRPCGVLMIWP